MRGRLRSFKDRVHSSFLFVPTVFVVGAICLGELMLTLDARIEHLPSHLTATVDSARNVLTVVAGATLSFAGIAFSVSLLLISLSSSQYSPRVVHGLFRDPFNKRVMGIVVGTFTYSLVVLRAVRGPLEGAGPPIVPSVSILLGVALGIVCVLAIVAFINHSAHSMDVSKILHKVTDKALDQLRGASCEETGPADQHDTAAPDEDGFTVTADDEGWVQDIDLDELLAIAEPSGCIQLETIAGRYAIRGTPLCTIWPTPSDDDGFRRAARKAVSIGESRTMQQDLTYGVRQLADVALKALSSGINDPTTAQDALFHLGSVIRELLIRPSRAPVIVGPKNRRLLLPVEPDHDELVGLAFDQIRLASAQQPDFQIYLLELLHLLDASLDEHTLSTAKNALRKQADLVIEVSDGAELPDHDRKRVRAAHRHRFSADTHFHQRAND